MAPYHHISLLEVIYRICTQITRLESDEASKSGNVCG